MVRLWNKIKHLYLAEQRPTPPETSSVPHAKRTWSKKRKNRPVLSPDMRRTMRSRPSTPGKSTGARAVQHEYLRLAVNNDANHSKISVSTTSTDKGSLQSKTGLYDSGNNKSDAATAAARVLATHMQAQTQQHAEVRTRRHAHEGRHFERARERERTRAVPLLDRSVSARAVEHGSRQKTVVPEKPHSIDTERPRHLQVEAGRKFNKSALRRVGNLFSPRSPDVLSDGASQSSSLEVVVGGRREKRIIRPLIPEMRGRVASAYERQTYEDQPDTEASLAEPLIRRKIQVPKAPPPAVEMVQLSTDLHARLLALEEEQRRAKELERQRIADIELATARLEGLLLDEGRADTYSEITTFDDFIGPSRAAECATAMAAPFAAEAMPTVVEDQSLPPGKTFYQRSKLAVGRINFPHLKRQVSMDSELSFADAGLSDMMECCISCGRRPEGREWLRRGKCRNCGLGIDQRDSKLMDRHVSYMRMPDAHIEAIRRTVYEDPGNPFDDVEIESLEEGECVPARAD